MAKATITSDDAAPETGAGYGPLFGTAFAQATRRVQELHHAIAALSFDTLQQIPVVAGPARLVRRGHDAIAALTYAAVAHGGEALIAAADHIRTQAAAVTPANSVPAAGIATGVRSALNGFYGDHLARNANPLAYVMTLTARGVDLELTRERLRTQLGAVTPRVCLFVHGLALDHTSWQRDGSADGAVSRKHYGPALQQDLGYTPLYLRYNTGLSIADNGALLSRLLQDLVDAYPSPLTEIVLIGHSMGGLLTRSACAQAAQASSEWLTRTRMVVCLGSPHHGAPLAQLTQLGANALAQFELGAPLAKVLNARSAGIKDLRYGLDGGERAQPRPSALDRIAHRYVASSLVDDPQPFWAGLVGDGLVSVRSATGGAAGSDVASAVFGGLSHLQLLDSPAVYHQIAKWLQH